jgi:hypothetical protein
MELEEIKKAVRLGQKVHWSNDGYRVKTWNSNGKESFDIVCKHNGHAIGLTWLDGITMNGKPEEFYIGK